jgi:hypothetical protein
MFQIGVVERQHAAVWIPAQGRNAACAKMILYEAAEAL